MSEHDHVEVTRRSFERQTALFTGDDAPFATRHNPSLAWVGPLAPEMVVADVACGAAHVAEQLAAHVREVAGVDLTRALLELGSTRMRSAGISNVLLNEADATALPFPEAAFDVVVCRGALHHFPDPHAAVEEMARVCRPGGRVVVSDMVAPAADVRDAFDELHHRLDPSHAHGLLEDEIAALLRSTVGPLTSTHTAQAFTLPLEHMLTDVADRDATIAALHDELAGGPATGFIPSTDDGQLRVSFVVTTVHARRDGGI